MPNQPIVYYSTQYLGLLGLLDSMLRLLTKSPSLARVHTVLRIMSFTDYVRQLMLLQCIGRALGADDSMSFFKQCFRSPALQVRYGYRLTTYVPVDIPSNNRKVKVLCIQNIVTSICYLYTYNPASSLMDVQSSPTTKLIVTIHSCAWSYNILGSTRTARSKVLDSPSSALMYRLRCEMLCALDSC